MSSTPPPIHREILVPAEPGVAFAVFTERIGQWWPLAELSVYGEGATVGFVDGRIVEESTAGARSVWGTVTRWEPGSAVAFTWHPGRKEETGGEETVSHVEVSFSRADGGTLVVLEHRGWDSFADPSAARDEYDHGWPPVLERYAAEFSPLIEETAASTWVALTHRPGPSAPEVGTVYEDPRFLEHVAFLRRMLNSGYLVAAGSFGDATAEGMTILRLPGPDRLAEATRLATEDDRSVAGGLFDVNVRPWQVALHA